MSELPFIGDRTANTISPFIMRHSIFNARFHWLKIQLNVKKQVWEQRMNEATTYASMCWCPPLCARHMWRKSGSACVTHIPHVWMVSVLNLISQKHAHLHIYLLLTSPYLSILTSMFFSSSKMDTNRFCAIFVHNSLQYSWILLYIHLIIWNAYIFLFLFQFVHFFLSWIGNQPVFKRKYWKKSKIK